LLDISNEIFFSDFEINKNFYKTVRHGCATMTALYTLALSRERLMELVRGHICVVVGRIAGLAEWLAKRAVARGIFLSVSYDRGFAGDSVRASIAFHLQETKEDAKVTEAYLRTRVRTLERYIEYLQRILKKDGIHCEVKKTVSTVRTTILERVTIDVTFKPVRVEEAKLLSKPHLRKVLVYDSYNKVAGTVVSFIKALESKAWEEYERGVRDSDLAEAGGGAEEGGGEEGLQPAGAGGHGAGGLPNEAPGAGWVRLIDACLEFGIPFLLVDSLIKQGRMEAKKAVGPDGVPYTWVKLEDVKKIREVLGGGTGVVKGGG